MATVLIRSTTDARTRVAEIARRRGITTSQAVDLLTRLGVELEKYFEKPEPDVEAAIKRAAGAYLKSIPPVRGIVGRSK